MENLTDLCEQLQINIDCVLDEGNIDNPELQNALSDMVIATIKEYKKDNLTSPE